jgi:hypothetical protein
MSLLPRQSVITSVTRQIELGAKLKLGAKPYDIIPRLTVLAKRTLCGVSVADDMTDLDRYRGASGILFSFEARVMRLSGRQRGWARQGHRRRVDRGGQLRSVLAGKLDVSFDRGKEPGR